MIGTELRRHIGPAILAHAILADATLADGVTVIALRYSWHNGAGFAHTQAMLVLGNVHVSYGHSKF